MCIVGASNSHKQILSSRTAILLPFQLLDRSLAYHPISYLVQLPKNYA